MQHSCDCKEESCLDDFDEKLLATCCPKCHLFPQPFFDDCPANVVDSNKKSSASASASRNALNNFQTCHHGGSGGGCGSDANASGHHCFNTNQTIKNHRSSTNHHPHHHHHHHHHHQVNSPLKEKTQKKKKSSSIKQQINFDPDDNNNNEQNSNSNNTKFNDNDNVSANKNFNTKTNQPPNNQTVVSCSPASFIHASNSNHQPQQQQRQQQKTAFVPKTATSIDNNKLKFTKNFPANSNIHSCIHSDNNHYCCGQENLVGSSKLENIIARRVETFVENFSKSRDDKCTKKDDCHCLACIQRRKIVEELIAEEESSKKKKQKKKKKKSNKTVMAIKQDENEDSKIETNEESSLNENSTHNNISSTQSDAIQQQASNKNSKKIKKSSKQPTNEEDKTDTDLNCLFDVNSDPTSVDIQQWIKVKNKYSKNSQQNSTNQVDSNWNVHHNDDDIDDSIHGPLDYDTNGDEGFKMINDRRRNSTSLDKEVNEMSSFTNNDSTSMGGKPYGLLTDRNSIQGNPIVFSQKAKLMAIEAQIAFNHNELKGAVQYASEAIDFDPKNPIYYINRAFYHEKLNEFEHALKDVEHALRLDDAKEFFDHLWCLKAKSLVGLGQYSQAEECLMKLKQLPHKPKHFPLVEKELLLLRLKALISHGYTLPLSRLYSAKFSTIQEALSAIKSNCELLAERRLNDSDVSSHLILIQQKMKEQLVSTSNNQKQQTLFDLPPELIDAKQNQAECRQYTEHLSEYDDDEIYFSDEEERDIWYAHPDSWHRPKDILNKTSVQYEDTKEPPNSKGQKALWIGNVSPNCSLALVQNFFMKFGNVTFCKIFARPDELAYLLLHYDNDISPRLVMSYFKDKTIPGISKDDACPLVIRFRNKNDKLDENGDFISSGTTSNSGTGTSATNSGVSSPATVKNSSSECYYWRTTGCDRQHCMFKHVTSSKGIDKQSWMRKKN